MKTKKMKQHHPLELESTNCHICGQGSTILLFERLDLLTKYPKKFQVVQCLQCSHVYLNPRPTPKSMKLFYPKNYPPHNNPHIQDMRTPWGIWRSTHTLNKRCRLVGEHCQSGSILDIGCSEGQFLNQLTRFGDWKTFGIEPDTKATKEAFQRYGLNIINGDAQCINFPPDHFDVVTMWDVIEHLHNPKQILQVIHKILKPSGVLIISTPFRDRLEEVLFGKYWVGYEIPRHLHIFSYKTLNLLLNKTGFKLIEAKVISGSNHALADSISFVANDKRLIQQLAHYGLTSLIGEILTAPVFKLLDHLQLTTPVTTIWHKHIYR